MTTTKAAPEPEAEPMTVPQLEEALARLGAEQMALEANKAAAEQLAALKANAERHAYYSGILSRGKTIDDQLESEGRDAYDDALAAVAALDISEAFTCWCAWQRTRRIRHSVRAQVQSAASVLGAVPYTTADLSMVSGTFGEWLGGVEHHAIEAGVTERLHEIIGTIPGTEG